jgi:hypothetical protein
LYHTRLFQPLMANENELRGVWRKRHVLATKLSGFPPPQRLDFVAFPVSSRL